MKRQTILAFDMLEREMECMATEEQQMYKGGTGEGDYGSGSWVATGSGIWDADPYSSGFYSSGYNGDYGSGDYGSGNYDSGNYGSGAAIDPGQLMDSYVDANGGRGNWSGGVISGVGYVGPTTTIAAEGGSSSNGVMDGLEAAISGLCTAGGLTSSMTSAICSAAYGKEWESISFKCVSGTLKIVGRVTGIGDVIMNAGEILSGDQTSAQNLEDLGQIVVGLIGFGLDVTGVGAEFGFGIQLGVTAWETAEMAGGR